MIIIKPISNRISYNPYYTQINAILSSGSWANDLFCRAESELGSDFRGIGRYFKAANIIRKDSEDINEAIVCIEIAAKSFSKFYERAQRINFLSTERECTNKKIGKSN